MAREDSQILLIHTISMHPSFYDCQILSICILRIWLCRQEWVTSGAPTCAPSLILTPEQSCRRSLYFQPEPTTSAGGAQQRTAVITSSEVQAWITRELQAITLEQDVKLLCQVVLGCLPTVVQSVQNTGRRYLASCRLLHAPHI